MASGDMTQEEEDYVLNCQWYRDPDYPMDWWQSEVASENTRANYMDWVLSMYEMDGKQPPAEFRAERERLHDDLPLVSDKYRNRHPEDTWQAEVESLDTRLGYDSWVVSQLQFDDEWLEEQDRIARANEEGAALDAGTPSPLSSPARPRM